MSSKIFLTVIAMAAPLMMVAVGSIFSKAAPKSINPIFGYRTAMSMKNEDTWSFAHAYCGRMWFICGLVFSVLTAALLAFSFKKELNTYGALAAALCFLCVLGMVWAMMLTERALKEAFDENGERRTAESTAVIPPEAVEAVAVADDIDGEDAFFEATDTAPAAMVEEILEELAEESIFDE